MTEVYRFLLPSGEPVAQKKFYPEWQLSPQHAWRGIGPAEDASLD